MGAAGQEHFQDGSSCVGICPQHPQPPHPTCPSQPAESASLPNQLQLQLETEVCRCWHQPALKNLLHPLPDAGRGSEVWEREWGTVPVPNTDSVLFSNQEEVKLQTGSSQTAEPMPRAHLSLLQWHMQGCEGLEVGDVWELGWLGQPETQRLLHQQDAGSFFPRSIPCSPPLCRVVSVSSRDPVKNMDGISGIKP